MEAIQIQWDVEDAHALLVAIDHAETLDEQEQLVGALVGLAARIERDLQWVREQKEEQA